MIGRNHGFVDTFDGLQIEGKDVKKNGYVTSKSTFDMSDLEKVHLSMGGIYSASVNAMATLFVECVSPETGDVVARSEVNWAYNQATSPNHPVDGIEMDVADLKGEYLLRIGVTCWNKKNYLSVGIYLNSPIKLWGTMD